MRTSTAATALEEVSLCGELASRYEALIRLAEVIRSHPEQKDLFQTFASELHQVIPFDGMSYFDAAANWVQWHFLEPYNKELEAFLVRPLPRGETVPWWVYRNQQPLVMRFTDQETRFPHVVERLTGVGFRSLCAVPLSTAHRQLGSLVFASHLEDAYSAENQQFLSLVANQIAVAMDDARAQQRLKLLLDLTNRVVTKLELRDLLHETVASIRQVMQCDSVGVALPDPENGELRVYARDFPGRQEIVDSGNVSVSASARIPNRGGSQSHERAACPELSPCRVRDEFAFPLAPRQS